MLLSKFFGICHFECGLFLRSLYEDFFALASFSLAFSVSLQAVFLETFIFAAASSNVNFSSSTSLRAPYYPQYPTDPVEELKALQDYKKKLETELAELTKRIEDLKKLVEGER